MMHRPNLQYGMSLAEVMVAIALMVVTLTTFMGVTGQQQLMREQSKQRQVASEIASALAERIQTADWSTLGTRPWSYGRYADGSGHPPLTERAANSANDISQLGLVVNSLGLIATGGLPENIHVYLEWYRAIDTMLDSGATVATEPGLFSTGAETSKAFRDNIYVAGSQPYPLVKTGYRPGTGGASYDPDGTSAPTAFIASGQPIAARIIITWGPWDHVSDPYRLQNRLELFVARGE